jgi:hypothetical protein
MEMEGQRRENLGQGTQGNSYGAHKNAGRTRVNEGISQLRLCVDNSSVAHVTNALEASSRPMTRELRRLQQVLDELRLQLSTEWISSVARKIADAVLRRSSPGDLEVRQTLRHFVVDGMVGSLDSFPFDH